MTDDDRHYLPDDWYDGGIPGGVHLASDVYIDSSYAFARMLSQRDDAISLDRACGVYDRASFVVGPRGQISVGSFSCLNGVYFVCHDRISVGKHCLFAWGSVVMDSWLDADASIDRRRNVMRSAAHDPQRWLPHVAPPQAVTIEDNVWVGFDSIVLPGVRLGRGCLVGCKSVVSEDVPAYAIFVGNPGRVVRYLDPDDSPQARQLAFREHLRAQP